MTIASGHVVAIIVSPSSSDSHCRSTCLLTRVVVRATVLVPMSHYTAHGLYTTTLPRPLSIVLPCRTACNDGWFGQVSSVHHAIKRDEPLLPQLLCTEVDVCLSPPQLGFVADFTPTAFMA